jgi:hypothetical protein
LRLNGSLFKITNWLKFCVLLFLLLACLELKAEALPLSSSVHKFISCIDGQEDYYALLPGRNNTLIVYLHSLNGDYNEPFKVNGDNSLAGALLKQFPGASFLSFNYGRNPSWGTAAARIDISRFLGVAVKELNIKRILLVGVSMGATTTLTYSATAPDYIKNKIVGIVAVSPCANLEDLYKQTEAPEIKSSLENVFGIGNDVVPIGYGQNSFDACVMFLPSSVKVGIISATEDKVVPIDLQKDVMRDLSNRDITVKSYEVEGNFDSLPVESILEASRFVMQ